jgi:hypothetical protein
MARTDILWAGRLDGAEGVPGAQAGLGPPDGQPFGLADRQVVTLAGWQRTSYSGLAELLGAAITGDAVSAEALATADLIAFEHNGGGPAHSGGWESCAWEFSDGQSTLAVPWNEATIGDVHLGTPVPRDWHVVANGSITGAAYGAFFGIPAAVITQFQPELAPEQIVFSFLLFGLRDEIDVTDPAFRVTIRGVPKVPGSQEATPDPDAVGVLLHPPAETADPVLRGFLLKLGGLVSHTLFWDEHTFTGSWSHPNVPLLIFADNVLPAASVSFHGGPIGTGLPVQLVFWGAWWSSIEGTARRVLLTSRVQALLASDYFSELEQYGIARPTWRGGLVVTRPVAPAAFNSDEDTRQVPDLIDALIDDDVFPDPDDGRIAFVVLMPKGFTQTIGANGAHTYGSDYEFPFDTDSFWVAWVRYFDPAAGEDPESTIQTVSHELVEMFTDPEDDGWYADPAETGELSDAGVSPGVGKQTAWVSGVHVQSYWSNRHSATVIPIDRDYAARIAGRMRLNSTKVLDSGTFRPEPGELALCHLVPECCIEDRDYTWNLVGRDEVVTLRVETTRFRQPKVVWTIEGGEITGAGTITVTTQTQRFTGRDPSFATSNVDIRFQISDAGLELRTVGTNANFDLTVGCRVTDDSITGRVATNVTATPSTVVGFVGAEVVLDPFYMRAHQACGDAARAFFKAHERELQHTPLPGEPVELAAGVIAALPAYARLDQYLLSRRALALTRLAAATLPADAARSYLAATRRRIPILQIVGPAG